MKRASTPLIVGDLVFIAEMLVLLALMPMGAGLYALGWVAAAAAVAILSARFYEWCGRLRIRRRELRLRNQLQGGLKNVHDVSHLAALVATGGMSPNDARERMNRAHPRGERETRGWIRGWIRVDQGLDGRPYYYYEQRSIDE